MSNLDVLRSFDKEYYLRANVVYKGFNLLPAFRTRLFMEYIEDENSRSSKLSLKDIFKISGGCIFWLSLTRFLKKIFSGRKNTSLFFTSISGLNEVDGQLVDAYALPSNFNQDSIVRIVQCSDNTNTERLFKLMKNNGSVMGDNFFFKLVSRIAYPIFMLRYKLNALAGINKSDLNEVASIYSRLADKTITIDKVMRIALNFVVEFECYRFLLRFFTRRSAVVISTYTKAPLMAALRKLNFRIVEPQHGVAGCHHFGYGVTMPYKKAHGRIAQPDVFIAYDKFWKAEMVRCEYLADSKITVSLKPRYRMVQFETLPSYLEEKEYFIITGNGLNTSSIAEFICNLLKYIDRCNLNFFVVYRPHPREDEGDLKSRLRHDNLERFLVVGDRNISTELLIIKSRGHVSVSSACHFDAIALVGKTFLLDVEKNNPILEFIRDDNFESFCILENSSDFDSLFKGDNERDE